MYRLLIDCYRVWIMDCYNLEGLAEPDGLYGGAADNLAGFRRFLKTAAAQSPVLPAWWDASSQTECEAFGMGGDPDGFSDLRKTLDKGDITKFYIDPMIELQLRMLGESVHRRRPGAKDGAVFPDEEYQQIRASYRADERPMILPGERPVFVMEGPGYRKVFGGEV